MQKGLNSALFWTALERNFPLSGTGPELDRKLGSPLVHVLQTSGVLSYLRHADRIACPKPGGEGCPRRVVKLDEESWVAVCGQDPPECQDLLVNAQDVAFWSLDVHKLAAYLRSALTLGGKIEPVADMPNALRVGSFVPTPGVRRLVFFVSRASAEQYAAACREICARYPSRAPAILIPSDEIVSEALISEMQLQGVRIVPLSGLVEIANDGQLEAISDSRSIFVGLGRRGLARSANAQAIAQVITRDGWNDLSQGDYDALTDAAGTYDVFADQLTRVIMKKGIKAQHNAPAAHFELMKYIIESKVPVDPEVEGPYEEKTAGRQVFQRLRPTVDIRNKKTAWALFKTVEVSGRPKYLWRPDKNISYAFVFVPTEI